MRQQSPAAPAAYTYVKAEAFESNSGTTDGTCSNLASVRWETTSSNPFGSSNVKVGDANIAAGMLLVHSKSAAGVYTAAFGNTSQFTTAAPNALQTSTAAVANNYFSYGKLPACSGTPVAGSAWIGSTTTGSLTGSLNTTTVGYAAPIELEFNKCNFV